MTDTRTTAETVATAEGSAPPPGATPAPMLPMARDGFDPVPELRRVREREGVARVLTPQGTWAWVVTRYEDVRAVLADPVTFSNAGVLADFDGADSAEGAAVTAGNFVSYDPPEHTRLRKMLGREFTRRRIDRMAPRVDQIVADHLDAMERTGPPADLVADFALPVPAMIVCELLGVPWEERDRFQALSVASMDTGLPDEQRLGLLFSMHQFMGDVVARAQAEPGEDLLGMLVREHGEDLSTAELTGIALLMLIAGHETTANMLSVGTFALLSHPDQLALVREGDPAAVDAAVDELLRWLTVAHTGTQRTATADTEIAGVAIAAGDAVLLALAGANRDPALVDDPERLDVTRAPTAHVTFGHGVHHCIGAPLARREMATALPALLRRFPDLALAVPAEEVEFLAHHAVYGVRSLPVTW